MASSTGRPMTELLDEAVEALERRLFFEDLNARFAELRVDRPAWESILQERRIEEGASNDHSM